MSAMSASPVKPSVLPPSGVSVPPPVATSPPKVGLMPMPPSLTIEPSKPPNMNHTAMPLSLIADHKMAPQFTPQTQIGAPQAMQPISQPLPRTPEKPKELPVPATVPPKPTSNGMEGPPPNLNPTPLSSSVVNEVPLSAVIAPPQKLDTHATKETSDSTSAPPPPEISSEPTVSAPIPQAQQAEKKDEPVAEKPIEPSSEVNVQPVTETHETAMPQPTITAASASTIPCPETVSTVTNSTPITPTTATMTLTKQPTPPPEQPVPPTITSSSSRIEPVPHSKPEMKVATIPRQAAKRKREPKISPVSPVVKVESKDDERKSKRVRLPTQPYQSPLPELNIIAKINKSTKSTPSKAPDDKLIVFYKNEFLAVRNDEGGFYVCQAMQNIYKSSARIRIRWLSQEEGKDTYSPDFYDHTDFDCILTNLNLDKVDKEKFKLPPVEQQRTESILKRALDVERGVSEKPPVTEEHPDGLDLSLFRDESQLKKSSKSRGKKSESVKSDGEESVGHESGENIDKEEKKIKKTAVRTIKKKKTVKKKKSSAEKKTVNKSSNDGNKSAIQSNKKNVETRVASKRKSSISSNSHQPPEKKVKKSENNSQPSDRTNKTRSTEAAASGAKPQRDRRTKSRK